jgi:hypothetical protein
MAKKSKKKKSQSEGRPRNEDRLGKVEGDLASDAGLSLFTAPLFSDDSVAPTQRHRDWQPLPEPKEVDAVTSAAQAAAAAVAADGQRPQGSTPTASSPRRAPAHRRRYSALAFGASADADAAATATTGGPNVMAEYAWAAANLEQQKAAAHVHVVVKGFVDPTVLLFEALLPPDTTVRPYGQLLTI